MSGAAATVAISTTSGHKQHAQTLRVWLLKCILLAAMSPTGCSSLKCGHDGTLLEQANVASSQQNDTCFRDFSGEPQQHVSAFYHVPRPQANQESH